MSVNANCNYLCAYLCCDLACWTVDWGWGETPDIIYVRVTSWWVTQKEVSGSMEKAPKKYSSLKEVSLATLIVSQRCCCPLITCDRTLPCIPSLRSRACTCSSRSGSTPPPCRRSSNSCLQSAHQLQEEHITLRILTKISDVQSMFDNTRRGLSMIFPIRLSEGFLEFWFWWFLKES